MDMSGEQSMIDRSTGQMSGEPVLQIENVTFGYSAQKPILRGVSVSVFSGEILALLGVNGAGKSTLIRLILGFERAAQGRILIDGMPISGLKQRELAKHVAYVPQAHIAPFPYSVRDVVLLGRIAHTGLLRPALHQDFAVAESAMHRLGIEALADRPYTMISGGERQLVLIARALAQEARILVMDEPASGLDYGNQIRLLQQLRSLADDGYAIFKSTHNPDHVLLGADRVALLVGGSIRTLGTPNEILTKKEIRLLYDVDVDFLSHPDGRRTILANINSKLTGNHVWKP